MSGRNPARRLTRSVADRAFDYVEAKRELDRRTSPLLKATLRTLWAEYHAAAARGGPLPSVWDTGLRVFSEHDEDGLVLFLLAVVGCDRRWFVDIGSGDGVHASNCANLAFNLGFHGLFVEADEESVARGRAAYDRHPDTRGYAPRFVHAFATAATVDATIREAGFQGDIALLSVDIDGNDYWIWKAIESVAPRVVVIETHPEHGAEEVLAPYREDFDWRLAPPGAAVGASPAAMTRLAGELGYRLVGGNRPGFNAVYLRNDLARDLVPSIEPAELSWHGRNEPFRRVAPER